MTDIQDSEIVEKVKEILKTIPKDYTGRLMLGMDLNTGHVGRHVVRVTYDLKITPKEQAA